MERPNHLQVAQKSNVSRATSILIVIAIHVAGIAGLIAALAQGALIKQLQEIKATVEEQKVPPKAPPPPPPELQKPPPVVPIVPEFTVQTQAPAQVTTQKRPPPPPPAPPRPAPVVYDPLRPILRTHTLPPYPPISVRLNEQGTTLMEVNITTEGNVSECTIVQSSSSQRLDQAACDYVKSHWKWQPPTANGKPMAVKTRVSVKWDLRDAK